MVEQLICNQQVEGSSPSASSRSVFACGEIPERSKGADCKSVGSAFEGSNPSLPTTSKGPGSSVVERFLGKEKVGSSILLSGSSDRSVTLYRPVAQLVEQRIPNPQVAGSIPVWPAPQHVRFLAPNFGRLTFTFIPIQAMFNRIRQFFTDVQTEFRRVQWPTREKTLKQTSIVVLVSLIIAIYLGVADLGLSNLMQILISG